MAWTGPRTTVDDRDRVLGPGGGERVHAVEYRWLHQIQTVRLYAYRLPAAAFRPIGQPRPYAMVSRTEVVPLVPPEPVGDLLGLHATAGIQLRVLPSLWEFLEAVADGSLEFSAIRIRNTQPRRT